MGKDDGEAAGYKAALARVGHRTQDSMADGTVEGLMYVHSENDERKEQQPQTTTLDASKPSPVPFTTSPRSALLSLPSSPVSPLLGGTNDRERRPSLAASVASTGSWEGASDIYDDYRYSRFSMTSKVSTMSSRFSASGAASGVRCYPNPTRTGVKIEGGILPLKDGFSKVQAAFAVTTSVGGGWYDRGCSRGLLMTGMGRHHLCLVRPPRISQVRCA